ncbi:MAG TPA: helix-turn-helix transcriptional regulator [Blastocatellia bacterium]|nr:helix-turn-helix transcriptional regulator [Blastocatellia bacterium]
MLNKSQINHNDRPEREPRADFPQPAGDPNGARAGQGMRTADAAPDPFTDRWRSQMKHRRLTEQTPLAVFVQNRLAELGMKQSEFCRLTGFDQGLLSKIQSSMINNLSLETALRLAVGLSVPPDEILTLIDREDLHTLITRAYPGSVGPSPPPGDEELPAPIQEINRLARRAYDLGRSLSPVIGVLAHLAIMRGDKKCMAMEMSSER